MKVYQLVVNEAEVRAAAVKVIATRCINPKIQNPPPEKNIVCVLFLGQPCKFLLDTVFAKGMTVRQSKEELLPQLREQCKLDLNIDRWAFVRNTED